jgi:hypothetical protein
MKGHASKSTHFIADVCCSEKEQISSCDTLQIAVIFNLNAREKSAKNTSVPHFLLFQKVCGQSPPTKMPKLSKNTTAVNESLSKLDWRERNNELYESISVD